MSDRKLNIFLSLCMIVIGIILFSSTTYAAQKAEIFQRNYITDVYHSDQGVDGSSANCIYAAEDGIIWIGSYTGLLSYDSYEFTSYQITDFALSVNAVTQDKEGNIWVGTNGNGLYYYDGEAFHECPIDSKENMAYTINELVVDQEGNLWIASKLGIFFVDLSKEEKIAVPVTEGLQEEIRDLSVFADGRKAFVSRLGDFYLMDTEGDVRQMNVPNLKDGTNVRCIADIKSADIYLGTNDAQIIHLSEDGEYIRSIETSGLESFNQIYEMESGLYWVCSDNGIGILEGDVLTPMDYALDNSVEAVCEDYQGNYWFASSRQGIMHIYENYFTDLSNYLKIKQMVNSIMPYQDKLYIGSDSGLVCYRGQERQTNDSLVKECTGVRVREIYVDHADSIWIVTYQKGLICQKTDGEIVYINEENSDLTTNALRNIYERKDGTYIIGTERGIFSLDQEYQVSRLVNDVTLNRERILTISEDEDENIYVGTDGDGIYVIQGDQIIDQITMKDGIFSNVILKIRTSTQMDGIWIVTGAGVCFVDQNHKVEKVSGISIANSLDLIFLNEEEVAILAGNGFFRLKEKDLLKDEMDFIHYDKKLGLPIDFTANASNVVRDGVLYMCGTDGATSLELNKEEIHREIRIHVKDISGDQKSIYRKGQITTLDSETHRLNLDVRILNFTHDDFDIRFKLDGTDSEASRISNADAMMISYTNLKGGEYNYHFEVLKKGTDHVLAEERLTLIKTYTMWERPYVRFLLVLLAVLLLGVFIYIIMVLHDKELRERYRKKYLKEHKEELEKLAYRDIVTGFNNRNCYEQDLTYLDVNKLFALSTVSINHGEYLRHKYGVLYFEDILKKTAQILKEHTEGKSEIYRLSEYIFCIWFEKPVDLESYILQIKESFIKMFGEEEDASTLAVGAVYHDSVLKERYEELFKRCDEMRILDQKHEEMKFMERKIQYMNLE